MKVIATMLKWLALSAMMLLLVASAGAQTAKEFFYLGNDAYQKNDYDAAVSNYTEAIRLSPDRGVAYFSRGQAYFAKSDLDHAIADFTQAIKLGFNNAETYY